MEKLTNALGKVSFGVLKLLLYVVAISQLFLGKYAIIAGVVVLILTVLYMLRRKTVKSFVEKFQIGRTFKLDAAVIIAVTFAANYAYNKAYTLLLIFLLLVVIFVIPKIGASKNKLDV